MRFVVLADHSPEACPGSVAKVSEVAKQSLGRLEELGKKYGVKLISGDVLSPSHKSVMIVEAKSLESLNRLLWESNFPQWNSIEVYEALPFQEAVRLTEELDIKPIW